MVWQDDRVPNTEIRMCRLLAGSATWEPSIVASDAAAIPVAIALGVGGSGDAVAVWQDARGTSYDIWGADYASATNSWSAPSPVSDDPGSTAQLRPTAALQGTEVAVAWRDDRTSGGDIRARRRTTTSGVDHFTYAYDGLNRLTSVAGPAAESFTLDAGSNIASRTGPNATNSYDGANRLTSDGVRGFVWDGADRLTQRGDDTFAYDPLARLVSATVAGSTRTYRYDGDGLLVSRTEGVATTSLLWDASVTPAPLLASGTDRLVDGLGPLYLVRADGSTLALARDGLGSVRAEVTSTGVVARSVRYAAYGTPVATHVGTPTLLSYAGELADSSGLIYLRARWYDPAVGRFMSKDRLPGWTTSPLSLNAYGYTHTSPIGDIDPSGLFCVGLAFGGSAVLGSGVVGAAATTSLGIVVCAGGSGFSIGVIETVGAFGGGRDDPGAIEAIRGNAAAGAYAGLGLSGLFSPNATQVSDFGKEFRSESVDLGIGPLNGSVNYSSGLNAKGGAVDVIAVTPPFLSLGAGAAYSLMTTWTFTQDLWSQSDSPK